MDLPSTISTANEEDITESHIPSFFQNSLRPGEPFCAEKSTAFEIEMAELQNVQVGPEEKMSNESKMIRSGGKGGFTCCVPHCFNNNKIDKHLSFYTFPDGASKEKILLRKKWIHFISRKDFRPNSSHRVCSEHFPGGRKTYMNNFPSITPKTANLMPRKERPTVKARNRIFIATATKNKENIAPPASDFCEDQHQPEPNQEAEKDVQTELNHLREENKALQAENTTLKADKVHLLELSNAERKNRFSLENIKDDPKLFKFYCGLPNYETFNALLKSFGSAVFNLVYHGSSTNAAKIDHSSYAKHGPKRSLTPAQEFFLVLVRLRLGLLEGDLAHRAGIKQSTLSKICITWFDFLHSRLRMFPIWPTRACIDETMPSCFKDIYPTTRVIIDCTEFYIEKASSVRSQSVTYSNYKHYNTAKALIGITPAGTVSFVSDLYSGRTSDKQATKDCGILHLLEEGDSLMADKGFDIEEDLPKGVSLNIPPFLRGKEHLNIFEEKKTRSIAAVRIHVERAISRIKTFKILSSVFPIRMAADMNKVWVICSYLTNFLPPLIAEENSTK